MGKKKLVSMVLALIMVIGLATTVFASSNPIDVSEHTYTSEIARLDGYNALAGLIVNNKFYPDRNITRQEFFDILTRLFPGRDLGTSSASDASATMEWACGRLSAVSRTLLGCDMVWNSVTTEELTRGRACMLICVWLDCSDQLKSLAGTDGTQQRPTATVAPTGPTVQTGLAGFFGPDEAWYSVNSGLSSRQDGIEGFWHLNSGLWFAYQCNGSFNNSNSRYGCWENGKWKTYTDAGGGVSNPTVGFIGPDGRWYETSRGLSSIPSDGGDGFWYGPSAKWYTYQTSGSHEQVNTDHGYWSGGKWWTYGGTGDGGSCPFTDINGYYRDAIVWMYNRGYTSGVTPTTFVPEGTCSKAQALTFVWRAAGKPASNTTCPISGIARDSYYYTALCWAAEKGMITGSDDGTDPAQVECTRAALVYYLWCAAGKPDVNSSNMAFTDVPSNSSYRTAVAWAVREGITNGTTSTTFSPFNLVTRGQIAVFLFRTYAH